MGNKNAELDVFDEPCQHADLRARQGMGRANRHKARLRAATGLAWIRKGNEQSSDNRNGTSTCTWDGGVHPDDKRRKQARQTSRPTWHLEVEIEGRGNYIPHRWEVNFERNLGTGLLTPLLLVLGPVLVN